eukprot:COSAG04_NODE_450_length_14158_cov_17.389573_12_plen_332_part_00
MYRRGTQTSRNAIWTGTSAEAEALWKWAEGTVDEDGKRWLSGKEIEEAASVSGVDMHGALCELMEPEPIRGPRAVLGGRVGTVIQRRELFEERALRRERDWVEMIQVQLRWEDDGTESDWIEVSDLDEPLGEGSAVRHNGRRGTAATEPGERDRIRIRWEEIRREDDYGQFAHPKVSELDVQVSVGREDFVAACAQHPERTTQMFLHLAKAEEKADAAVLEAKIAAVWRWADTIADGELGATELLRLADRVSDEMYDDDDPEKRLEEVCGALGLGAADEAVSIDEEAFAVACRARKNKGAPFPVKEWFAKLGLGLAEERSCLADLCAACGC